MYSSEEQHRPLSYRVVHDNLPIFLANKRLFEMINTKYPDIIQQCSDSLRNPSQGERLTTFFALSHFSKTLAQTQIDLIIWSLVAKFLRMGQIQGLNEK